MDKSALLKEAQEFGDAQFKRNAAAYLEDSAGQHFDSTPELVRAFCPSPRPSAAELAEGKKRYVESFLRQVRSDSNCPPSLK